LDPEHTGSTASGFEVWNGQTAQLQPLAGAMRIGIEVAVTALIKQRRRG